ncbi:MAG: neuraminidase-like domain-containing protein [Actinomycetota bacterium]|nr:neuraminidase-like domain-containing protein [Actinomycetota bacterium]
MLEKLIVHGRITDADGREVPYAEVTVWHQRIRDRHPLGSGDASEEGTYEIEGRLPEEGPGKLLLVVEARSERLTGPLESGLIGAQPDLEVDLQERRRDQSEYGELRQTIELQLGSLPLDEVVESDEHHDVSFLSREMGRSSEDIIRVAIAARLEAAFDVPAAAFYAFLRQHVPSALPAPLADAADGFALIDALVRRIASLIFALSTDVQTQTLERAVAQGLIEAELEKAIPELVKLLQSRRTTDLLGQPFLVGKATLGELLAVAGLAPEKHEAFARTLAGNGQSMRNFWRTLASGESGLTDAEASNVQRTLELGAFVKNHVPLVQALLDRFNQGQYTTLSDLARPSLADWTRLVEQVGPPPSIQPAGTAQPAEVYAKVIYTRVTRAYPTAALSSRIAADELVPALEQEPLNRFFANNRSLDLIKTNVATYVEQDPAKALAGIASPDQPVVLDNVKRFQRMLRIVPEVDPAQSLLRSGIQSATQIATMGRQQFFVQAVAAGLTKVEANRVYRVAERRYADVISNLVQFNRDLIGIWPKAVGAITNLDDPTQNAVKRDQSLATLFGSQDYCAVDDCTSVLSPAAYLCDLLLWLRGHSLSGAIPTALDALDARRPDIRHLLLNCPNTDIALPYVDLVNELLEDAVAPPTSVVWRQTTQTSAELRAAPEYVNTAAYEALKAASYPHTLPYDKPLDELRTYLSQSGISLWQLRETLLPLHSVPFAKLASVAAERFAIDPHEQDLVTTLNSGPAAIAWNTANPGTDLVPVEAFLHSAAITYEQLLQLLEVVWVRDGGAPITLQGVNDTCDLNAESLAPAPLDAAVLDRLHRFLRLWRHATWHMWELDMLVQAPAVANGTLDGPGLVQLQTFRDLTDITGLAVDRQLAFYSDLDTSPAGHRAADGSRTTSLYAQLFLNPAVPADADLAALAVGGAVAHPNLSDHLPAIQAALQISADDAAILFAAPITNGQLTLSNLSQIYRVTALAAAVKSSMTELLALLPITSAGSLTAGLASPAATLAFIREVKAMSQSGFSAEALLYVLTHGPSAIGIPDEQIAGTVLPAVRAAIRQTHDEVFGSVDPPIAVLQRELAQLPAFVDPLLLTSAIAIIDDTSSQPLAARNAFISANFGLFMDVATAQSELAPLAAGLTHSQRQAAINQRASEVLASLATYLTRTRVIAALAPNLQLQADVIALLAEQLTLPASATTLLTVLTDAHLIDKPGGTYTPLTRANFGDAFTAVDLLDKVGIVVKRLHLVRSDLAWLLGHAAPYGGLELRSLPVTGAQPAQPIAALLATSLIVKLERAFTATLASGPIGDLYGLIAAIAGGTIASVAGAQSTLATVTGWRAADIAALCTALGAVFPGDYEKPATYDALRTLQAMLGATGASGDQLVAWAVAAPGDAEATSARGALKAKYSEPDWLAVAPKLMDPMRERRSAALQAYLIAKRDAGKVLYADADALFDHFLIDVEMSSCEMTTRVIQAFAAVELFVERCLMSLEEDHGVVVDLNRDDTWTYWRWMKRYRIWEAAREVFLYPENWLIESQRPNRTQIFEQLEHDIRQSDSTNDYMETVAQNYIDRLDELAHLQVTGTCVDPKTGTIHAVARTSDDPPRYYHRTFSDRVWSGWKQVPLNIKAHQVVPAIYRGRVCLFWIDVVVKNEPRQPLPPAQQSSTPPSQDGAKYVAIGLNFSIFRNGAWAAGQRTKGCLFDMPFPRFGDVSGPPATAEDPAAVERLYTIKAQSPAPAPHYGARLLVDVFRLGKLQTHDFLDTEWVDGVDSSRAVQIGRAHFDGRFADLELRDLPAQGNLRNFFGVLIPFVEERLLTHAQNTYGPDAQPLLPLPEGEADPDLAGEPGLTPQAGALATRPPNSSLTLPLTFTSLAALEQNVGELLHTASVPFRVVGDVSDLAFDPASQFFYQDNRRCYFVEGLRYYQWGSAWLPVPPSYPASAPFEVRYSFHRFYHPYTRLMWHQLGQGGFPALYDRDLQLKPDTIDPSGADVFSFRDTYQPFTPRVTWGEDNEIIDFGTDAAYAVYNWELFFHAPLFIAERLSQNQKFEDALKWFHYIFDPTRQGPEPIPQRFWIMKPLGSLTAPAILAERINNLLLLVNQRDPNAVAQVDRWKRDPFNPFLLADQRPVAYMKRAVMSYLDNLIAWADNLFSTDSREALNEATLLYVIAAEMLGPKPVAVTPPQHADASYDDLEPKLDAFANAMVAIENVVPAAGGGAPGNNGGGPMPRPQTFYFKIPPNDKLLGYWTTVADRLFKLRHCQNIAGVTRSLALFDAPIDPGLLVRAQAAGVDLGSVLSDLSAPRPGYRFTALYQQALDFCNSVMAYGAELQAALTQNDAAALALLLAGQQQQIETENGQVLQSQIDAAAQDLEALQHALELAQAQQDFAAHRPWANTYEAFALTLKSTLAAENAVIAAMFLIAGGLAAIPEFTLGVAGFGGTPAADTQTGGWHLSQALAHAGDAGKAAAVALDKGSDALMMAGTFQERSEQNDEKAKEAGIQGQQVQAQIAAAQIRHDLAVQQLANHQNQLDRLQHQIDYLTDMFTSEDLYDWMIGRLSDTYFGGYRLAYKLCQQVERCYRYELGLTDSSFIQFGYWDNLKKGLQAGEALTLDLRRMEASYLDKNARRFEISRFVSLAALDPHALLALLEHGACDFDLPESLFDGDYPGHYQRRLQRVSVTVVYPSPGRFDNVKCTLTMKHNSVRTTTDLGAAYGRQGAADARFIDEFGAVPQKIVLGNGQDDPGLFLTAINDNLNDQRYLPFEGAGAISSWHLELPPATNEIDLAGVSDIVLRLYYSALDGGDTFKQAVQADNAANAPTAGAIILSATKDFPDSVWQQFLAHPGAGAGQTLILDVSPSRFPNWSRGKTITITSLTVLVTTNLPGNFVLRPDPPLATADVTLTPVAGASQPNVISGAIVPPPASPGTWSFKIRTAGAAGGNFQSLTPDEISDVLLMIPFQAA